ncbi:DUF1992 domain-containing protein [Geodermatophilus sp. SYSU D00703]
MTERKPPGMSFQTWVDQQITQAQARGAFDDLDGAGRPLPRRDRDQSSHEWALEWARRQSADPRDLLPPGLALRRERDELPGRVAGLPSEAAVRAVADDFNARVEAFWRRPQESRWAPVPGLADVEALVAHWQATRPPPAPPAEVTAAPPRRRRWWRRRR